jgi:hypothetical protein
MRDWELVDTRTVQTWPWADTHPQLSPASLSMLSYEDVLTWPVITFWNDLHHLMDH